MVLALLKMGFSYREALAMGTAEADGYIEAYNELMDPKRMKRSKTYKVRRKE